jgi:dCTP deaminase
VGHEYKVFTPDPDVGPIDVLNFNIDDVADHHTGSTCILPPHGFALAKSVERVRVPDDCIAILIAKSTYARAGIGLNTTPIEPGWEGIITIEIINYTPRPNTVYSDMGIGQLVFIGGTGVAQVPYHSKKRPYYQNQTGITPPRV